MTDVVIALLTLAGVVVSVILQFWFNCEGERRKCLDVLRAQSYVDYLHSVATAAHANAPGEQQIACETVADAKARIAGYGTANVVVALARFERAGAVLNNDLSSQAFAELVSAMRQKDGKVGIEDIQVVLVGAVQREDAAA
jgi:hypothetical protein